jgi:hypothetical protein
MPPLVDSGSGWGLGGGSFPSNDHIVIPPPPGTSFSAGGGGRNSWGDFGADTSFQGGMHSAAHEQFPGWEGSGGVTSGWGSPGASQAGFGMGGSFGGSPSGFGDSVPSSPYPFYGSNNPYPSTPPRNWDWSSQSSSKLGRPQKYQTGLSRSRSYSPYSNASSLTPDSNFTRSFSSGHPSYQQTYAERPSEWRQGFSFRSGLASLVHRRTPSVAAGASFIPSCLVA